MKILLSDSSPIGNESDKSISKNFINEKFREQFFFINTNYGCYSSILDLVKKEFEYKIFRLLCIINFYKFFFWKPPKRVILGPFSILASSTMVKQQPYHFLDVNKKFVSYACKFNGSSFLIIEENDGSFLSRAFLIERDCVYFNVRSVVEF